MWFVTLLSGIHYIDLISLFRSYGLLRTLKTIDKNCMCISAILTKFKVLLFLNSLDVTYVISNNYVLNSFEKYRIYWVLIYG